MNDFAEFLKKESAFPKKYFKDRVCILGNGEGRLGWPLELLKPICPVYACNGIFDYEKFEPDILFYSDQPVQKKLQETKYKGRTLPRSAVIQELGIRVVGSLTTGGIAMYWAATRPEINKVFLIGFDPFKSKKTESGFNTAQLGSGWDRMKDAAPTCVKNIYMDWGRSYVYLFKRFNNVEFIRYAYEEDRYFPPSWEEAGNVSALPFAAFIKKLMGFTDGT